MLILQRGSWDSERNPAMVPNTWGIWGLNLERPASQAQPLPTDPGHHTPREAEACRPSSKPASSAGTAVSGRDRWHRLTLLALEAAEAGMALASVVVDGLHAVAMAAAGRRGAGSCGHTGMARSMSLGGSTVSTTDITNDTSARHSD